jgi:hypothetical protein
VPTLHTRWSDCDTRQRGMAWQRATPRYRSSTAVGLCHSTQREKTTTKHQLYHVMTMIPCLRCRWKEGTGGSKFFSVIR